MSKTPGTDELAAIINRAKLDHGDMWYHEVIKWLKSELTAAKEKIAEQEAQIKALQVVEKQLNLRGRFILQESFTIGLALMKSYAEESYEQGRQFEANAIWHAHDELVEFQSLCRAALKK